MQRWIFITLAFAAVAFAKSGAPTNSSEPVTVPITIDHNRVVIDVSLVLPDGTRQSVKAWVDNGDPDLFMTQKIAAQIGLGIACDGQLCTATPSSAKSGLAIDIGGMKVPVFVTQRINVPVGDNSTIVPGIMAEIKIPSSMLRSYDVLIDFADRKFTIGLPGTIKFNGVRAKALISASGLVQVPAKIENKNYSLSLDLGSSISFLSPELFEKLSAAHHDWPQMTGAIGPANEGESSDESKWKLMRVDRIQYGPLYLTDVAVAELPARRMNSLEPYGKAVVGLLGSDALINYRVGFDYAHSFVYFDIGRTFKFPAFDVVGLTLRPESNGNFTIIGIADFDGKPSAPEVQIGDVLAAVDGIPVAGSTMGQAWAMLQGMPNQQRELTLERSGKQLVTGARVCHFLADTDYDTNPSPAGKSKKQIER